MSFRIVLCIAIFVVATNCGRISEDVDEASDIQLKNLCNRNIPEDQSVDNGGECRSSTNCQQVDATCVHMRGNYCECQGVEERIKKWKRKFLNKMKKTCKKNEGYSCSKKSKCQKKYRKRGKICKHPRHVCCTKCNKLDEHDCMPRKSCPKGSAKIWHQCDKKSDVCCEKPKCPDVPGHMCTTMEACPGSVQVNSLTCDGDAQVCCVPYDKKYEVHNTPASWPVAEKDCEDRGGALAMFKNADEVAALWALKAAGTADHQESYWIGIKAQAGGGYKFIDGTPVADHLTDPGTLSDEGLIYWSDDEFSSSNEYNCMSVYYNGDQMDVFDDNCDDDEKYICETYVPK